MAEIRHIKCKTNNWKRRQIAKILQSIGKRGLANQTAVSKFTPEVHIHHTSQYPHLLLFPKPSPLRRWNSALYFLPSGSLRLQHRSPSILHSTLDRICSWMTANPLTLNSSKTEFLLIGLSKLLAKINNSSLTTTHSARNLGFIFDGHLTFSD